MHVPVEFADLVDWVAGRLEARVDRVERSEEEGGDLYVVDVPLKADRRQLVRLQLEGISIRMATRCSEWQERFDKEPGFYRTLLERNHDLSHGYFAMDEDGNVELVDAQLLVTCDPEELYVSIDTLAKLGDALENELHAGQDEF